MIPLRMASIGGFSSSRGSLFHVSATDSFHLGSPSMPSSASLGAGGQAIYDEGKKQVELFDSFVAQTKHFADKAYRAQLIDTYGLAEPENKDKALYMRNATAASLAKADSYMPINYLVFEGPGPDKNRPRKLEEFNVDFAKDVKYGLANYDLLPDAQIIERTTTVSTTPGWVLPVTIGAVAVAALAAFGVFSGK